MINLTGTGVAMVTPFKEDESIDFSALKKLTDHLVDNGIEYLVVLGTTGETATLSKEEKRQVFEKIAEFAGGRIPLVAGLGGNSTSEVVATVKSFDVPGYSAVLSVCPYYNKPNQSGIIKHYTAVADASSRPVILYNVPGRTGVNMKSETTLKLAEHKNIIAMKEASGNFEQCMEILKYKEKDFYVISGDDAITLPLIATGMSGVISVIANAYPRDFSEMVRMALGGNMKAARELHYKLLDLSQAIFADGSPGGIKEILNFLDICGTKVRLPLDNVSEGVKSRLLDLAGKIRR